MNDETKKWPAPADLAAALVAAGREIDSLQREVADLRRKLLVERQGACGAAFMLGLAQGRAQKEDHNHKRGAKHWKAQIRRAHREAEQRIAGAVREMDEARASLAAAVAEEREVCAKLAESSLGRSSLTFGGRLVAADIASAIRARGEPAPVRRCDYRGDEYPCTAPADSTGRCDEHGRARGEPRKP